MLTGHPISFGCVAVVPVLIGPLQILVAVLPPLLGALGAMLLALFKPAAAKTALRVMWRNKLLTTGIVVAVVELAGAAGIGGGGRRRLAGLPRRPRTPRGGPRQRRPGLRRHGVGLHQR
jgi:hypothetical protein